MRDGGGVERALPVAADSHDGAVGAARVHPRAAAPAGHAAPALPRRPAPQPLVSTRSTAPVGHTVQCYKCVCVQCRAGDGGERERAVGGGLAGAGRRVQRVPLVPPARRARALRRAAPLASLSRVK